MTTPRKLIKKALKSMCPTVRGFGIMEAHLRVRQDEASVRLLNALFLLYLQEAVRWKPSSYLEWEQTLEKSSHCERSHSP